MSLRTAGLLILLVLLSGCASKELKPDIPDTERKALQESIRKEGIAIVADGCVNVHGFYTGFPVAKVESVMVGAAAAQRAKAAFIQHGYHVQTVAMPFICGRDIGMAAWGKPYTQDVVEKAGDSVQASQPMPLALPQLSTQAHTAYAELFTKLVPLIRGNAWNGMEETKELAQQIKRDSLLNKTSIQSLKTMLGSRYLLLCSARSTTRTKANIIFSWVVAILGGAAGATGGIPPTIDLEQKPGAYGNFEGLQLQLIDLQKNRLLWADEFSVHYPERDANAIREEENTRSLWRLLTPLH